MPEFFTKFKILNSLNIKFGFWLENITASDQRTVVLYILFAFVVIFSKNCYQLKFKPNTINLLFAVICFIVSVLNLDKVSEFLYFNF